METNTNLNPEQFSFNKNRKSIFLFLGFLILVVIFIYWYTNRNESEIVTQLPTRPTPDMNKEPESPTAYAQVQSLNTMSTSDELGAIEADLESTSFDSLLLETTAIEAELSQKQ